MYSDRDRFLIAALLLALEIPFVAALAVGALVTRALVAVAGVRRALAR